jgi:hypothetical protein
MTLNFGSPCPPPHTTYSTSQYGCTVIKSEYPYCRQTDETPPVFLDTLVLYIVCPCLGMTLDILSRHRTDLARGEAKDANACADGSTMDNGGV